MTRRADSIVVEEMAAAKTHKWECTWLQGKTDWSVHNSFLLWFYYFQHGFPVSSWALSSRAASAEKAHSLCRHLSLEVTHPLSAHILLVGAGLMAPLAAKGRGKVFPTWVVASISHSRLWERSTEAWFTANHICLSLLWTSSLKTRLF